ncbi:hypothetical protein [Paraburkholderia phosphatilytica]|uniref:hypothetical protein n=1 Tax=Paraburkholderia phosphatilytica TaxID=2282883 RepID=UPI000F5DDB81|nr:hypothetical protein [Paraburkholderia phosphatilytica]
MKRTFIAGLALFSFSLLAPCVGYALAADAIVCGETNCPITLSESGLIVDVKSSKRVFDLPVQETMFDSYSLTKRGQRYYLERSNTTSSRNWQIFIFRYDDKKVYALKLISLSRSYGIVPAGVEWSGFECRGSSAARTQYAPFESAEISLCNGRVAEKIVHSEMQVVASPAKSRGLKIDIPFYGKTTHGVAVYSFGGDDEPRLDSMVCLKNCLDAD